MKIGSNLVGHVSSDNDTDIIQGELFAEELEILMIKYQIDKIDIGWKKKWEEK